MMDGLAYVRARAAGLLRAPRALGLAGLALAVSLAAASCAGAPVGLVGTPALGAAPALAAEAEAGSSDAPSAGSASSPDDSAAASGDGAGSSDAASSPDSSAATSSDAGGSGSSTDASGSSASSPDAADSSGRLSEVAATELLDPDRTGSVSVSLLDTDGSPVGGSLAIYRVADAVSDARGWHLEWRAAYASMGDGISSMTGTLSSAYSRQLAVSLALIVQAGQDGTEPQAELAVDADGSVTFTGLPVGMYLVRQTQAEAGYATIDPFVVTVPVEDPTTGQLIYSVEATPKAGAVSRTDEPPTPDEPDEPGTPDTPETPETPDAPTPEEPSLPRTGQAWTPVLALFFAGVALLLAGAARLRRRA